MNPLDLLWLFFISPACNRCLSSACWLPAGFATCALEKRRGSRAISLIHRRESFSFLGIPFGGFIDIEDSEAVIRAIEMTGKEVPIDLVLHTPSGLMLAAEQIASALGAAMSEGRWTHDFPINVTLAQSLGFKVSTDLPGEAFTMMSPYPQSGGLRPSVEYVPAPYQPQRTERGSRHIPGTRR